MITRQPPPDPTTLHVYEVTVKPTASFGTTSITWSFGNPNGPPGWFKFTLGITPGP